MIREVIERYYNFYWIIFITLALTKIVLSIFLEGPIRTSLDFFIAIFKWYNQISFSLVEVYEKRIQMYIQNTLTLFMYLSLAVIVSVSLLKTLF